MTMAYIVLGIICLAVFSGTAVFGWYFSTYQFLTNTWWAWFLTTYTITVSAVIAAVVFILKLAAIINPNIPSNQIIDLIKDATGTTGQFPKLPVPPAK